MASAGGRCERDKEGYIGSGRGGDQVRSSLWQTDAEVGLIIYAVH